MGCKRERVRQAGRPIWQYGDDENAKKQEKAVMICQFDSDKKDEDEREDEGKETQHLDEEGE